MSFACRIEADSVSPKGVRLTTFVVTFPRFVLAELNTHRVFSRNAASSRAIPVVKRIAAVKEAPFVPTPASNIPGMQAGAGYDGDVVHEWRKDVLALRDEVCKFAEKWQGVHKQWVNRYLEPWSWVTVIISATEWEGFYTQRFHKDAQPEFRRIAEMMRLAHDLSTPRLVPYGSGHDPAEYHLPFTTEEERKGHDINTLCKIAVGRCARVSYETHDGKRDIRADVDLCDRLLSAEPPHASPFEHVAWPQQDGIPHKGNFRGWHQLRHAWLSI